MDQLSDPASLFKDNLQASFEKIAKNLPKKYKEVKELLVKFKEQVDTDKEYNANKYFLVYKLCIETKITKLVEICLYYMHKLISHGFLDGNCKDYTFNRHLEEYKPTTPEKPELEKNRKLIDAIVDSICSCINERDENVQLQIIKVLLTIVTSVVCEIHDRSLLEAFRAFYHIYITSKNNNNQTSARAALTQMLHAVFQRMEGYNSTDEEYRNMLKKKSSINVAPSVANLNNSLTSTIRKHTKEVDPNTSYPNIASPGLYSSSSNDNIINQLDGSIHENQNSIPGAIYNNGPSFEISEYKSTIILDGDPIEKYIYKTVVHMIDDVCIYHDKINTIKSRLEENNENGKIDISIQEEMNNIPLRTVPLVLNADDPKYRNVTKVNIVNEKGQPADIFGWCFVCRSPAKLYCKDTRVPICSLECKKKHLEEIDSLDVVTIENDDHERPQNGNIYLHDAVQILKLMCKLSAKEPPSNMNSYTLRSKILLLEMILALLENPGPTFISRKEFVDIIKESLCDSLLKNSVSSEKQVLALSLGIFVNLVYHFREYLKQEISVFIDSVFLKMLESGNSSYYHRFLALQVFYRLTQKPKTMLEFYVNYDCDVGQTNIVEKMIEFLSKIAQGKYSKLEYSGVIGPKEEQNLKILALDSMLTMTKNLVVFSEEIEKKMEETRKKHLLENNTATDKDDDNSSNGAEEAKETDFDKAESIEKSRSLKNQLQKAIQKFNFKPKAGIKFLINLGVIKEDAKDIANYIRNNPTLSKSGLGEYFGEEHELNIKVLTEFTETVDFRGLALDEGLRVFLDLFELPGESQKVDRIMQVYAGKYVRDNTEIFTSITAAYQMAYLLMMLQTDAHNPQVKEKMKFTDFTKLAKGINEGKPLTVELMQGFYNRILKSPLALPNTERMKKQAQTMATSTAKQKQEQFMVETVKMIEKGKELIKNKNVTAYITLNSTDYVRPLFEMLWSPLLAALSVLMEQYDDSKIIQLCLDGFTYAIKLTGMYSMNTERDAFVLGLVKFTALQSLKEIKEKNLKAIKALLFTATNQGNHLKSSWKFILDCISKIDYYMHYTPPMRKDDNIFSDLTRGTLRNDTADQIDAINSETIRNNIDPTSIDFIFNKSSTFELDEIIEFISGLCKISEEELKTPGNPRTYCLQKLVEVAHFNMDRIKFIWAQIWNIMKEYFSKVGVHPNKQISMFAVDSLKQLSIKFLRKEELASSDFQRMFLKPFETIFLETPPENQEIKDLILSCIDNIISHSMKNLKSGWKIIFDILGISASSDKDSLVELSFRIVQKMMSENLTVLNDHLMDLLDVVLKFVKNKNEDIVKEALDFIVKIITTMNSIKMSRPILPKDLDHERIDPDQMISDDPIQEASADQDKDKEIKNEVATYYGITEEIWIKILSSLSAMASDYRQKVQSQSLSSLFRILTDYGEAFSKDFWQTILSAVIKPLFDEIQYSLQSKKVISKEQVQAFRDICEKAYVELVKLYSTYFQKLRFFTDNLFAIILNCIQNPQESLAKISVSAFKHMINMCSDKFSTEEWESIVIVISKIIKNTTPDQLLESKNIQPPTSESDRVPNLKFSASECITQCVVQLLMVGVIKEFTEKYYEKFTDQQIERFLEILESSYKFARTFNDQIYLRYCLWKNGFNQDMQQLPGLLKQEKDARSVFVSLVYSSYVKKESGSPTKEKFLTRFIDQILKIMSTYCVKHEEFLDSLKKEKLSKTDPPNKKPVSTTNLQIDDGHQNHSSSDDDSIESIIRRLKLHESERDLINLRTLISAVIMPKLLVIDPSELQSRLKDISHSLINISVYSFSKCYACYSDPNCPKNIDTSTEVTDSNIRLLLTKYFDYSIANMSSK